MVEMMNATLSERMLRDVFVRFPFCAIADVFLSCVYMWCVE